MAVAVVIGPRCARAKSSAAHAGLLRDVLKLTIAQIVVKHVAVVAGDVYVRQSVIVIVGDGDSHAPALARESGFQRDVCELQILALTVEGYHRHSARARLFDRRVVYHKNVQLAAIVAVEKRHTARNRLDDVVLILRAERDSGDAGLFSDFPEMDPRRLSMQLRCGKRKQK